MRPKIAQRWQQQLAWLDGWFGLEKADRHAFDPAERELFEALSRTWLAAEDKIGALEATSARFGRDRVRAMLFDDALEAFREPVHAALTATPRRARPLPRSVPAPPRRAARRRATPST